MISKFVYMIGKLVGKGSSMPGKIALKLDKNILKKVALPDDIIVVTGSNGKTSTVEMICSGIMLAVIERAQIKLKALPL